MVLIADEGMSITINFLCAIPQKKLVPIFKLERQVSIVRVFLPRWA